MMKNGIPTDPTSYGAGRYADSKDPIRDWVADEQNAGRVPKAPAVLAAERAETDASTRTMRLRAACDALVDCPAFTMATIDDPDAHALAILSARQFLMTQGPTEINLREALVAVRVARLAVIDGSDPARFTACNVALDALGRLWACS